MTQDEQYLNVLSILHFVYAGIKALFSCFFLLYPALGIAGLAGAFDKNDPMPAIVAWFFIVLGFGIVIFSWILAGLIVIAGVNLKKRKHRTFCIVIAAIECISMPLGTILGIFTIIVLMKDSAKKLFETNQSIT